MFVQEFSIIQRINHFTKPINEGCMDILTKNKYCFRIYLSNWEFNIKT